MRYRTKLVFVVGGIVGLMGATLLAVNGMTVVPAQPPIGPDQTWPQPNLVQVRVEGSQLRPRLLRADQGPVTIEIRNADAVVHACSISGIEDSRVLRPGETQTLYVPELNAGTYELWCGDPADAATSVTATLLIGPPLVGGHVEPSQIGESTPIAAVHRREQLVDGRYTLHRLYFRWSDEIPSASLIETLEEGRTALVSWNSVGSGLTWADIAAGEGDERIREVGKALAPLDAAYPGKLFFAWHHEPEVAVRWAARNAAVETGTGAEFAAGWQRVFRIFSEEGFTPLRTLISDRYDPEFTRGVEFDVLGPDHYPWSPLTPDKRCSTRWASFGDIWEEMRSMFSVRFPGKPVLIGETGAQEKDHPSCNPTGDPRAKGRWFHEAIPAIDEWAGDDTNPLIGVGVFDSGWYRVDTSPHSLRGWADLVRAFQPPASTSTAGEPLG
jgi:hypothetical protein